MVVYSDDLEKYHAEWNALLLEAFPAIKNVKQPLRFLISGKIGKPCLRIADGTEPMRSILNCYHAARP